MPSGISHMLLSRVLPIDSACPYRYILNANIEYFQFGSIGPDLPYVSAADHNFLETQNHIADLFHFAASSQSIEQSPNKLPILGLQQVRELRQQPKANNRECDALFWFLAGYASHVIADGICHPFVMDKVGPYEGENKSAHRALEMGMDVLLFKHLTASSGHALETSYAGMNSFIASFNELDHTRFIFDQFSRFIATVYDTPVSNSQMEDWVQGMALLFSLSTGKWPDWFRNMESTIPFVFREIADLTGRESDYLLLGKPKFWESNFRQTSEVHLIDDCLPRFNQTMKSYLDKAYAYVYESGPQISELDLPAFSLDTGRTVNAPNNVALKPILWEMA